MRKKRDVVLPTTLEEVFSFVSEFAQHLFAFPATGFIDLSLEPLRLLVRLKEPVGNDLVSEFSRRIAASIGDFSGQTLMRDTFKLDLQGSLVNEEDNRPIKSYFACPIAVNEKNTAVVAFCSNLPAAFSAGSIQLVSALAEHYSRFLSNVNSTILQVKHQAEMHLLEEKLRSEKQLVEKLRKLDELKSGFISMVSHELRTPMTAIKSSIQLILDETAGTVPKEQKKWLSMAMRNIDRLSNLIGDVLDVSRIERGNLKLNFNMNSLSPVIEEVVSSLENKSQEMSSRMYFDDIDDEIECYFDRDTIIQVLTNLVGNALSHNPPGTKVSVRLEEVTDVFATIAVSDNGRGIEPEDLEHIFDKFYQVEKSLDRGTEGTGLGLAISKGIVDAHGGRLWCESTRGKGSVFKFILPRSPEAVGKIMRHAKPPADWEVLFGKIAVLMGYTDESKVEECIQLQGESGDAKPIGDIMVSLGILSKEQRDEVLRVQRANLEKPHDYDPVRTLADILLGRLSLRFKYLTQGQINECVRIQASRQVTGKHQRLGEIFIEKGYLTFAQVLDLLSLQGITVTSCMECGSNTNIFYYSPRNEYWCRFCGGKLEPVKEYSDKD